MDLARSCVQNSWQFGMAVLVVRSYRLLQSVIAKSLSVALYVGIEIAGGSFCADSGFCHSVFGSKIHAQ